MAEVKRVFVGGLSPEITEKELTERFQRFCEVLNVQIKKKKVDNNVEKTFAYLNVKASAENLQKCISVYDRTKWKGSELRLQLAKENFLSRLERERENGFMVEEKKKSSKKDTVELHNPFENLPDPSTPEMKGCVPGTKVPGERNWVVGKYGRVLPVVYVRNKDKKKVVKVDPSKFCHNLKKIKDEEEKALSEESNLTLEIEDIDNELSRKRKGEFVEWKPTSNKQKKYDFDALREKYLNNDNVKKIDNYLKEPEFEIVSENAWLSKLNNILSSDESDSDSDYTSLKSLSSKSPVSKNTSGSRGIKQDDYSSSCDEQTSSFVVKTIKRTESESIKKDNTADKSLSSDTCKIDVIKNKPKMQAFGGTRLLYATSNVDNQDCKVSGASPNVQQSSTEVKSKALEKVQYLNTTRKPLKKQISSEDSTLKKEVISKNNSEKNRKEKSKPKSLETPVPKENDGYISASSADTDEIIHRSKCMSPTEDIDLTNLGGVYDFSSPGKHEKISPYSTKVNEFSSGLVAGEIPDADVTDDDYRYSDDSEESDFEKFVIKETKKISSKTSKSSKLKPAVLGNEMLAKDGKSSKTGVDIDSKRKIEKKCIQSDENKLKRADDKSPKDKACDMSRKKKDERNRSSQGCNVDPQNTSTTDKVYSTKSENPKPKPTKPIESVDSNSKISNANVKKKPELNSNQKRLASLKKRQEENKAQKTAIKNALANIDSGSKSNKKIVFDSDSEESDTQADVKENDSMSDGSSDYKENDSMSDGSSDVKENNSMSDGSSDVNHSNNTSSSDNDGDHDEVIEKKKLNQMDGKTTLFDSSEEDEFSDENDDGDMFHIRPEFEGKSGQKRMELQSRYGNDKRFKLDERFIESDDEAEENVDTEELIEEDERTRALKILEEVVGTKLKTKEKGKKFKDVSALHFDPTREDHSQFEIKATEKPKKEKEKKSSGKKILITEENEAEELPDVSKEKFFEVSDSLTDAFKGSKETNSSQGFSLLATYGSLHKDEDDSSDEDDNAVEKSLPLKSNIFPWQQKFSEDYSSDSDQEDQKLEHSDSGSDDKKTEQPVVFSSGKSFFFFQENDERISEGVKRFCRQGDYDTIKEKWLEKRSHLVEAYRTKHKRLVRKMKVEGKHKKTLIHKRRT